MIRSHGLHPSTPPSEPGPTSKQRREQRLRWQSGVVLVLCLPLAIFYLTLKLFRLAYAQPASWHAAVTALCICTTFVWVVWKLRAATRLAAVTGGILAACMYFGTAGSPETTWAHSGIVPLLGLFVLTYGATRYRRTAKERQGTAEPRRGRDAAQVCANVGVAALTQAPLMLVNPGFKMPADSLWLAPMLAALVEATADTVSSEIGQVIGGTPRMLTNLRPVAAGSDGAISFAGTAAGCFAAAVVVCIAAASMQLEARTAGIALGAGIFGFFFDSLLGATLERRDYLNNDAVNFFSTLAAAVAAGVVAILLHRS